MKPGRPTNGRQRKRVIRRLVSLMELCRAHRCYLPPLPELAREFQCNERTIRRDLEAMEECGLRVPQWRLYEKGAA